MISGMKVLIIFMLIMTAGVFHILFTMFDYGFNNPDSGGFTLLDEQMNETLTGEFRDNANARNAMLHQFFGIGRVVVLAVCVIAIAFILFDRNPGGG